MPQQLWAPWRMAYIEKPETGTMGSGDIFIELPRQDDDERNLILYRGTTAFVIMNAFPYTNGHLLVAPFRQTAEVEALMDEELLEINRLVASCVRWIKAAYAPQGFNIGVNLGQVAGAGIPTHIHWHVVPRWGGDTNFMTTVGDTRVLPESLPDSYLRLREEIRKETGAAPR